ncbi:MAG TPA: GNAT family N-acetyltransferase [Roseiflexaceae bacterium]|nr:GNAT family N-acetyltransferase [Roseiflexaceae bacterium]
MTTAPLSHMLLFSSDDAQGTIYAIAGILWEDVGMGLLAQRGEESPAPHILGIWVRPEYRRRGVGGELLRVLAATSQLRYGTPPIVEPVSPAGVQLVEAAQRAGVQLVLHPSPQLMVLP